MFKSYLFSPMKFFIYFFTLSFVVLMFGQKTQLPESGKSAHGLMYGRGKEPYGGAKSVSHLSDMPAQKQNIRKPSPRVILPGVRRLVPQEYLTIQAAIDACVDGDTVLVSEGTYYENIRYKGKAIVVASHYLVDGDTTHIPLTIINGSNPSHPDSGSVVYFVSGEDTTSVLCGFTITGGRGTRFQDGSLTVQVGGGIQCYGIYGARIAWNIIENNEINSDGIIVSGAGISAGPPGSTGYIIIENNNIRGNRLRGNSSQQGAGIFFGCNGRIRFNQLRNNSCHSINEWAVGGGIRMLDSGSGNQLVCQLEGNIISQNLVRSDNNEAYGGGLNISGIRICMKGNLIIGNELRAPDSTMASYGAGMHIGALRTGENRIEGNIFRGNFHNSNWGMGGGMFVHSSDPVLFNNILFENQADWGGGIYVVERSQLIIINNTIINNDGSGIFAWEENNIVVLNSIIWDNEGSELEGNITAAYCDISECWPGTGNIDIDPQFADTFFHLLTNSYCVGLGRSSMSIGDSIYQAPLFDLEGNPRPNPIDTLVDMGAYETPFPGRAQLLSSRVNQYQCYLHPSQDSVKIRVQIIDPHQQGVNLIATMRNLQGAVWEEFPLFDDGQHGDSLAGDNFFGAIIPPVMLEDAFRFNYYLVNHTFQDTMVYHEKQQLTSIGPLRCEGYHILSQDSNRIQLELVLRNLGQYSTATEVRAELIPQDSAVIEIVSNNRSFGNIPAGGTAVNSSAYIIDTIENPGTISFNVRISMGGYPYWLQENLVVGIEPGSSQQLPGEFALYQNYPNPFNSNTNIEFRNPKKEYVTLKIFNILGEEVEMLVSGQLVAGLHSFEFSASNLPSGVYFFRLQTGKFMQSRKMLLLR